MNSTKWRISKACHECRAKKIKCNGQEPCERCKTRGVSCVYRAKARNRARKRQVSVAHDSAPSQATPSGGASDDSWAAAGSLPAAEPGLGAGRSIHIHSVAATHRASPSCLLQLYYGPSSNFALLNSIYHQIEGTQPNSPPRDGGVEEVGPGLDLFRHRRLFFGDLADTQQPFSFSEDCSAMLMEPKMARRFLDRYLSTYWHGLPVLPKDWYRRQLDDLFRPPAIFSFDSPDTIIVLLAVGLGAFMTGEDVIADFLFQKAKLGASKLDEVVNVKSERARPNSSFLYIGTAVRKAIAAGLHKEISVQGVQSPQEIAERRLTFWSLYFWETWNCFIVGRPSSIPDPGASVPFPEDSGLLIAMVTLARIMSKCVNRIYTPKHDSLLPVWNAAMDIRQELHRFAEKQSKDMKFGLTGDLSTGELGICQAITSTMYHHTLLLTFRPFLILRAKLKQDNSSNPDGPLNPPSWLHSACEYCLEAARNTIGFLSGACEANFLCHDVKYHGFFIEGACYVLAFDMLQERNAGNPNLPWIRSALKTLRSMLTTTAKASDTQLSITITAIEQMVRAVIPDFELKTPPVNPITQEQQMPQPLQQPPIPLPPTTLPITTMAQPPAYVYPSMPFGFDLGGRIKGNSPTGMPPEEQIDFTAADMGWNIDFGTMDMEAFLSIDPTQNLNMPQNLNVPM